MMADVTPSGGVPLPVARAVSDVSWCPKWPGASRLLRHCGIGPVTKEFVKALGLQC